MFFSSGDEYRIHLRSGRDILLRGVDSFKVNFDTTDGRITSYSIKYTSPKYNTLFHIVMSEIVAIEKVS